MCLMVVFVFFQTIIHHSNVLNNLVLLSLNRMHLFVKLGELGLFST